MMVMAATKNDVIKLPGNMVIISEAEYEQLLSAKENMEYLDKLDKSMEQLKNGETISFSMEELKAMEADDWEPTPKVLDWMNRKKHE